MTEKEAIEKLADCQKDPYTASAHENADDVLCAFLESLGYAAVVAEYQKVNRWFE